MQDADYQERAVFAGDVSGAWSSRLNRKRDPIRFVRIHGRTC